MTSRPGGVGHEVASLDQDRWQKPRPTPRKAAARRTTKAPRPPKRERRRPRWQLAPRSRKPALLIEALLLGLPLVVFVGFRTLEFQAGYLPALALALSVELLLALILLRRRGPTGPWPLLVLALAALSVLVTTTFATLVGLGHGALPAGLGALLAGSLAFIGARVGLVAGREPVIPDEIHETRRRRVAGVVVVLQRCVAAAAFGFLMLVYVGPYAGPRATVSAEGPSLQELDRSIELAEAFIDGLYKRTGAGGAVVSEYYALPIRVRFPGEGWLLPGQDGVTLDGLDQSFASERSRFTFNSPDTWQRAEVEARIQWSEGRPVRVVAGLEEIDVAAGRSVEVYLGPRRLAGWDDGDAGARAAFSFPLREAPRYTRSIRYTLRHAGQLAYGHYAYRGEAERRRGLERTLESSGYEPGVDIYAPFYGPSGAEAAELSYSEDGYNDCRLPAAGPAGPQALPYASKVCRMPLGIYVWGASGDLLGQTLEALARLEGSGDPDRSYETFDAVERTPRETAARAERAFEEAPAGSGVPRCVFLLFCEARWVSAPRTAALGTLEAELGYGAGDPISREYADRIAEQLIEVQVETDGIVVSEGGRPSYRPSEIGGFYIAWDSEGNHALTASSLNELLEYIDAPPEYTGLVASNAETTLAAWFFLVRYRCHRYGVGCEGAAPVQPAALSGS